MNIIAENIDSKFWNIEYITSDILKSIEHSGKATIHLNGEGPAFTETNLYQLLECLKNKHHVDLANITVITGNVLEDISKEYRVVIKPNWMYELPELQKIQTIVKKESTAQKFGLLIGRSNFPRLMIAGHLFANLKDSTFLTFHYDSTSDYHKSLLGLEELIHVFGVNSKVVSNSWELLKAAPIKKDLVNYPIVQPFCYQTLPWYNNFFVEVICETYFSGNVFFPTEKTWRSIATKTPFIIQGPRHFIRRLQMLGFKTFDRWWDESYDDDVGDYKLTSILRVIDDIGQFEDMRKIYLEMEETLEHNYQVFKNLTTNKIQEIICET